MHILYKPLLGIYSKEVLTMHTRIFLALLIIMTNKKITGSNINSMDK